MQNDARPIRHALTGLLLLTAPYVSFAAGDYTQQDPITLQVRLGNPENRLRFFPSTLKLETGKLYRLVLTNPSPAKHYFSSAGLAASVFTRKVQINHRIGQPAVEVKGVVREIEVYPGHSAEWWFVPIKTGALNDLRCTVKGHQQAGMTGEIIIN